MARREGPEMAESQSNTSLKSRRQVLKIVAAGGAAGLSTLAMTLGARRSRELLEDLPGCEGYLVSKDLDIVKTSGFTVSG